MVIVSERENVCRIKLGIFLFVNVISLICREYIFNFNLSVPLLKLHTILPWLLGV